MGQFKPMVKMMTTEPTVELKLKKGGKVEKKMQIGGVPAVAPAADPRVPPMARGPLGVAGAAPRKPSLADRRRAMRAMPTAAAPAAPVGLAGRMMKEGGETKSEHKSEMARIAKTEKELKKHESKPASKAHKGLKTGGVVLGQGGFKTGGVVKGQGGYKTGGVVKGEAGYKSGGMIDTGKPEKMPRKKPSAPVSINQLSGTFKKGGAVCMKDGGLTPEESDRATAAANRAYEGWERAETKGNEDLRNAILDFPGKVARKASRLFGGSPKSVTETTKSLTVEPGKKRGGRA